MKVSESIQNDDSDLPTSANPKVSMILPAYNEEKEIGSAISELDNQTYEDREIIVVDDGSTDSTHEKAKEYAKNRKNVTVIKAKHAGPAAARNLGVSRSHGDIIVFGECDCVYDPDYVEKAVRYLEQDPAADAVCLTGGPLMVRSTLATRSINLENIVQHRLLQKGKIKPFYAWVYRRRAFESVGGFDTKLFQAEDKDLFARITKAGYKIGWIPGIHWRHKRDETLSSLSKKWIRRGRMRVLFSIKHGSSLDLMKSLLPLWALICGLILLASVVWIGILFILIVFALFLGQVLRIARISWSDVNQKKIYAEYVVFLATRNLSTGLGYSIGTAKLILRKAAGREISYENL